MISNRVKGFRLGFEIVRCRFRAKVKVNGESYGVISGYFKPFGLVLSLGSVGARLQVGLWLE